VDARHIVWATLVTLNKNKKLSSSVLETAQKDLKINPKKLNPMIS
jgi:pyruvate dehydrogenase complex dehydrogenase (E1) component